MRGIQDAVIDRVHHLESTDNRARRQQVDLDAAGGHLLHTGRVLAGEIHPDIRCRPGRLHLDHHRCLREHRWRSRER